jgi:prepilin-type N-terminal cleavage/methylation domain-containing protein
MTNQKEAFSLVELSIVLVILGLLTGGVLTGQSLIRASELRNVTEEAARYTTAIHTFRDKYSALPGDMRNATRFWPTTRTQLQCETTIYWVSYPNDTCDGNGNGWIETGGGHGANLAGEPAWKEEATVWQHLAFSGMISGTYSGNVNINANDIPPRYGISRAGNNGAWRVFGAPSYPWETKYYGSAVVGQYGNHLEFTGKRSFRTGFFEGALSTEEAWNIDIKQDDGRPGTGKIRAPGQHYHSNGALACATTANATTAEYNLNNIDYFTPGGYTVPPVGNWCEMIFLTL